MLPCRTAKKKLLHEVFEAAIDNLKMGKALLRNPEAVEINIRRRSTLKVHRIKIINLGLVKASEKGYSLAHRV